MRIIEAFIKLLGRLSRARRGNKGERKHQDHGKPSAAGNSLHSEMHPGSSHVKNFAQGSSSNTAFGSNSSDGFVEASDYIEGISNRIDEGRQESDSSKSDSSKSDLDTRRFKESQEPAVQRIDLPCEEQDGSEFLGAESILEGRDSLTNDRLTCIVFSDTRLRDF